MCAVQRLIKEKLTPMAQLANEQTINFAQADELKVMMDDRIVIGCFSTISFSYIFRSAWISH